LDISKTTDRIIEFSLIALLVFTPLARGTVQPWALSVAHFITLVILTAYVLGILLGAQPRPARTPLDLPLLALLLLVLVSSFFSIDRHSSLMALVRLLHYLVLYWIVANAIRGRDQVRRVAGAIVAVVGFLAFFGLIKYLGEMAPPWWDYDGPSKGLTATFANRNHLAGYMEMALSLTIGLVIAARRAWLKVLLGFLVLALCVALTLSLSRGGWISASVALGCMVCLYVMGRKGHYRRWIIGVVAVATVVVLTVLASTPVIDRLETLTHGEDRGTREGRPAVWAKTVDLIKDHPLLGTGPGTFAVAFTPYRPAGINSHYYYAHNDYLHVISETGLLTAGIILWLMVALFGTATKKIKAARSRLTLGITLCGLGGMVALMVHSLVDFNLHIMANATVFAVLARLVLSPTGALSTTVRSRSRFQVSTSPSMSFTKAVATAAIIGLFAWSAYWLYGLFMGDYYIGRAKEVAETKDRNTAIGAFEKALSHTPDNPEYHRLFGTFYLAFAKGAKEAAIKERLLQKGWAELEQARRASPRNASVYLALAQTAEALGRLGRPDFAEAAKQYYHRALSLYPNSAPYHYWLAVYLRRAGEIQEALHHLETMLTLDPSADRYIRHHAFWDIPHLDAAAERALEQALDNRFTANAAARALATRLAEKQQWLEAARVYGRQVPVRLFADRSGYHIQMGAYLLLGGQEEEAEGHFLRALDGARDLSAALKGVKASYKRADRTAQLLALFERFKKRRPGAMELELCWAQALYEEGAYQAALVHLDRFAAGKETPEADYWMAKTWKALGEDYKAETYIKQAIKWAPRRALFRHFYAGLLHEQWRFSEALEQSEAAIRLSNGDNAWYLDRRARILYHMKRYEEAIETWQRAARLKPAHKAFRSHIDRAAKEAGQPPL
jgi:O-antigen ligase/tetratricopeptide (TPR) repeat protein